MRKLLNLLLIGALAATFSCKDDDDDAKGYKFKDQNVMGKIANVNWAYADGYADLFDNGDEVRLEINLFLAQTETGCAVSFADGDQVFFNLPNETGLYKLNLNWNAP